MTALAISNQIDIAGHALFRFPLPAFLAPALDMVRASGRLFWPVAYTIVLVAILSVYRLERRRQPKQHSAHEDRRSIQPHFAPYSGLYSNVSAQEPA